MKELYCSRSMHYDLALHKTRDFRRAYGSCRMRRAHFSKAPQDVKMYEYTNGYMQEEKIMIERMGWDGLSQGPSKIKGQNLINHSPALPGAILDLTGLIWTHS